jgi:hypothetical protein
MLQSRMHTGEDVNLSGLEAGTHTGPTIPQSPFAILRNRRSDSRPNNPSSITEQVDQEHERIDWEVKHGSELRMAVIIRMPLTLDDGNDRLDEDVAWEHGMEFGVWEGHVG